MLPVPMELQAISILGMIASAGACILGFLYICAACIRDETALHDVKVEARRMRIEFDRRVFARNVGTHAESDGEVDEDGAPILVV